MRDQWFLHIISMSACSVQSIACPAPTRAMLRACREKRLRQFTLITDIPDEVSIQKVQKLLDTVSTFLVTSGDEDYTHIEIPFSLLSPGRILRAEDGATAVSV